MLKRSFFGPIRFLSSYRRDPHKVQDFPFLPVSNLASDEEKTRLGKKLQDVGQRQVSDVSVLWLELGDVEKAGHSGQEVLVAQHHALRRSSGS